MKYIIILGDGMAGEPLECIGGKTTLEQALTPEMDRLAKMSEIGLVSMVPEGMAPGSDTANLSVLGYNPEVYYTGRSPLEALSIGVGMEENDVSFRCNLVTLTEDASLPYEDQRIVDHSSDEINTRDAGVLLEVLKEEVLKPGFELYRGTSYRHLLLWKNGHEMELTPPHDILGKRIGEYLPEETKLREMMEKSFDILDRHPINEKRREMGLNPANSIWFWGAGTRPALDDFEEKTGKKGAMVSAVDLLKGIAVGTHMLNLDVEGATGGLDTNYKGKAMEAVDSLTKDGADVVYIHVEAPDEMGHQGSVENKVKAIEFLDDQVIRVVAEELKKRGEDFRMLIGPDHPTPISIRTHSKDPIPFMIYDSTKEMKGQKEYSEEAAKSTGLVLEHGHDLMGRLLQK